MSSSKEKLISDLTRSDLIEYPIWFFPMDESVDDGDLTVKPLEKLDQPSENYRLIVQTAFNDAKGFSWIGYVYWNSLEDIALYQPAIFVEDKKIVHFWFGIRKPNENELESKKLLNFPISFKSESVLQLDSISGKIGGFYYFDDSYDLQCL